MAYRLTSYLLLMTYYLPTKARRRHHAEFAERARYTKVRNTRVS